MVVNDLSEGKKPSSFDGAFQNENGWKLLRNPARFDIIFNGPEHT